MAGAGNTAKAASWRWSGLCIALLAMVLADAAALAQGAQPSSSGAQSQQQKPAPQAMTLGEAEQSWPRLESHQRHAVIEQAITAGELETAERLVARLEPKTAAGEKTAALFKGLILRGQGRVDEAIEIFRGLLASNPELSRVRLELAVALFMKQEDDGARHNFDLVLASAHNAELSLTVNRFIDAINARRRWTFSTYVSLAPSTNFNQGTNADIVMLGGLPFRIDDQARQKAGVGMNAGFSGAYRFPIWGPLDLVVGGGAHTRQFRDSKFDDTLVSGEIGPRYRFTWGDIGIYGTVARRWFGGDDWWGGNGYSLAAGGRISARARLDQQNLSTVNAACQEKEHDAQVWQNGWGCSLGLFHDYFIDSRTFVRAIGNVERETAQRPWLDYWGVGTGGGIYREIEYGVSIYTQFVYTRRDYGADFPGFVKTRQDDRFETSVQLTKRDWTFAGMAPMVQYSYVHNLSNIEVFKFNAHGVNLSLTRFF